MLPALFLSHGAPDLILSDNPARSFFRQLPAAFGKPKAILAVSAHWETAEPAVNAVETNATIHDFGGFPAELYAMQYPAPGSATLAERVAGLLKLAGFPVRTDKQRGLDHGAWVPLIVAYPDADIPVVQLSVQSRLGPAHHLAVGRALAALRAEGVLVMGSGSFTHNIDEYVRGPRGWEDGEPEWVTAFSDWLGCAILENRLDDLLRYREIAPYAEKNHPADEHLLPLYVALGAAGDRAQAQQVHRSAAGGVVRLDAFAFRSGAEAN